MTAAPHGHGGEAQNSPADPGNLATQSCAHAARPKAISEVPVNIIAYIGTWVGVPLALFLGRRAVCCVICDGDHKRGAWLGSLFLLSYLWGMVSVAEIFGAAGDLAQTLMVGIPVQAAGHGAIEAFQTRTARRREQHPDLPPTGSRTDAGCVES